MQKRPSTSPSKKSPTKQMMGSPTKYVTKTFISDDIAARENLTTSIVEITHDKSCEYVLAQHAQTISELQTDNTNLRQEIASLQSEHNNALAGI